MAQSKRARKTSALALEVTRIILRYIGVYLATKGVVSADAVDMVVTDPAIISLLAGLAMAAVSEAGWIVSRFRQWKETW